MSNFSLRLPNSLHDDLKAIANRDGVSVNQFIAQAVAEKVAVFKQVDRIQHYLSLPPVSEEEYLSMLEQVGNNEPPQPGDKMTPELERIAEKLKSKRKSSSVK